MGETVTPAILRARASEVRRKADAAEREASFQARFIANLLCADRPVPEGLKTLYLSALGTQDALEDEASTAWQAYQEAPNDGHLGIHTPISQEIS